MSWMKYFNSVLFSFFIITISDAQLIFRTEELGRNFNCGTVLSSADLNGDFLPDLLLVHQSTELWVGLNTLSNEFFWNLIDEQVDGNPWSINVVDINQDYRNDIILSGEGFGVIQYQQAQNGKFVKSYLDTNSYYSQTASLADVNNDKFPDLFVCGEFEKSRFYKNLLGKFYPDSLTIDLSLSEKDSDSGNYGAIWSDIDNDGDLDLYVSRCRPDVADPKDRRRRNLFFQNANGKFEEKADSHNITVLDQSWISEIGDLDNDGLQDLIVLNHYTPSLIFKQDQNHHFIDVTKASGFKYEGNGMQLFMRDMDNDKDLDLLVVGEKNEIWLNQGGMKFIRSNTQFLSSSINSCSPADFNLDGSIDILASFGEFINVPGTIRNRLFIGQKSQNNFIGFNLTGISSNTNAIGTQIRCYTGGVGQIRELRSGEGFGVTNSYQVHFGCGQDQIMDSLIIKWPSGRTSKYFGLPTGHYYNFSEDECENKLVDLNYINKVELCTGDSIILKSTRRLSDITWNNGIANDELIVKEEGIYFFQARDEKLCNVKSNPLYIDFNPETSTALNVQNDVILCDGESIELKSLSAKVLVWNTQDTGSALVVNRSGTYYALISGLCEEFTSDSIQVKTINRVSTPIIRDTTIQSKSSILLTSMDEQTRWYETDTSRNAIHQGMNFQTGLITKTREYWAERFESNEHKYSSAGYKSAEFDGVPFHEINFNGGLYFKVHIDCNLDSVTVYTDRIGTRRFILKDSLGKSIDSVEYDLRTGANRIFMGFKLFSKTGTYLLTTSSELNKKNFLNPTPWLFRSNKNLHYPINQNKLVSILHSNRGEGEYHYFYNWAIREVNKECVSQRIPVKIVLLESSITDPELEKISFYFQGDYLCMDDLQKIKQLCVYNQNGKEILKTSQIDHKTKIEPLPPGLYFIVYQDNHLNSKIVKVLKSK